MEPTEVGSTGGMGSRCKYGWADKLVRSESHPSGVAVGFLRPPVFRGHSSISMNNNLNLSSSSGPQKNESFVVLPLF